MTADVLIEIAKIQWAAEKLRESTAFLKDFEILSEDFPVIRTSINNLIAGPDRTIADLFDLTGEDFLFRYIFCDTPTENCIYFSFYLEDWADYLEGTQIDSVSSLPHQFTLIIPIMITYGCIFARL